jgi:hypothetical protein
MKVLHASKLEKLGLFTSLLFPIFIAAGCGSSNVKKYQVEIRVPMTSKVAPASRVRLVLRAADSLKEPNLSRTENYVLTEKKIALGNHD